MTVFTQTGHRIRPGKSFLATLMVALTAAFTLAACHGDEQARAEPRATQSVSVVTVASREVARTVTASGTIAAWEDVPVGAETGGLVATGVYADEGVYVRQGQVLVTLNDALLRAQLAQQDAALASAEATLAQAEAALGRAQELRERGFLAQAGLDNALAAQRTAAAQVAASRAARSETATRLEQTRIRAPVSGLVISRSVTRGQIVQPGSELFRMVRDGRLELNAQVPETELAMVRAGQSAEVSGEGGINTSGNVRLVTPAVDGQTRLGIARIALGPTTLRPGMFARATIDVGSQQSLTVPQDAIVFREGRAGVYVLQADSTVRFQPVSTGLRDGSDVVISAGLSGGERVVVRGAGFLGDGDRVSVGQPRAAAGEAPAAKAAR